MLTLIVATLLASNGTGKTMVRQQPGRLVSTRPAGPLIADVVNSVAHVTWNGSALVDSHGNSWSMSGAVPQIARSGLVPPAGGPFSDSNYYTLGTGADVLDFGGNFWACAIFNIGASFPPAWTLLFTNGAAGASGGGYVIQFDGSGTGAISLRHYDVGGGAYYAQTANAVVRNAVNVACFGRIGTQPYAQLNAGSIAATTNGTFAAGTGYQAILGRYSSAGLAFGQGSVIEMLFVNASPGADQAAATALFTSVINRVHSKLGITAW